MSVCVGFKLFCWNSFPSRSYKWPKVFKFLVNNTSWIQQKYSGIRRWVLLPEQVGHCIKGSPRYEDNKFWSIVKLNLGDWNKAPPSQHQRIIIKNIHVSNVAISLIVKLSVIPIGPSSSPSHVSESVIIEKSLAMLLAFHTDNNAWYFKLLNVKMSSLSRKADNGRLDRARRQSSRKDVKQDAERWMCLFLNIR